MEKFVIEGGFPLKGTVKISGAKNAALPLFAAAILLREPVVFTNVPDVADIYTMAELLAHLGVKVEKLEHGIWRLDASRIASTLAPYEIVRKMRASIYVLGPLLAREGEAKASMPGGCAFGPRPIDFHIKGLQLMGADITLEHGYIVSKTRDKHLHGATIAFDKKSVGATAHLMMAATLADGQTVITNAAHEPEVVTLAEFLNACGAKISGHGTDEITIVGVEDLHSPKEFEVIPDRIEAGTYAVAAFMTGGEITLSDVRPEHMRAVIERLRAAGAEVEESDETLVVHKRGSKIKPVDIFTAPYPGFPTDMQAQFMAMLSVAEGTSVIREGIYPDRFKHAFELVRLGADIKVEDGMAIVKGVKELTGAPVIATDLRASAALVLAGLIAKGTTTVEHIYHLDRGYERFEEKLTLLGAHIKRVKV